MAEREKLNLTIWNCQEWQEVTVPEGTTYLEEYFFSIEDTEYNRLEFLLYEGTIPEETASAEEKMESAYRDLHLWIKVN